MTDWNLMEHFHQGYFFCAFERQIWNNLLISGQKLPEPVIKLWPINEAMNTVDFLHLEFLKYYDNMW